MSKFAHSLQPTMDELDRLRAMENGDEDMLTMGDDMAPARGILNGLLIEAVAVLAFLAAWQFVWAALPGAPS